MKLTKLILENFRGYQDRTEIEFSNLNVIVGKNDIGKSTILDALDIFFNESDFKNDIYIKAKKKEARIGVIFKEFNDKIVLDTTFETSLTAENLLNSNNQLEIHKIYGASGLKKVVLISNYPSNKELKGLITLDIDTLKEKATSLKVADDYNASIKASMRQAIKDHLKEKLKFENQEIEIFSKSKDKESGDSTAKEIWTQIQNYLPVYALFQSDRKNEEQDGEIQNPMKAAIKKILKAENLQERLNDIKKEVQQVSEELAKLTIAKLREMNPEIARELDPEFDDPKWESAFKFNLLSDDKVPLNKRGSGVRRLILLNFFRAEAERQREERNVPDTIYALEEPETSQHPDHQKKLIEAFIALSKTQHNQIILTTHSPGIAKMLPPETISLISKDENGKLKVEKDKENIIRNIATELGVFPDIEISNPSKVKLAICVEGKNDITFLREINGCNPELKKIVDITKSEEIIMLPMGGSTLQFWVNNDYLGRLKLNQLHIYDSDIGSDEPNKYKKYVDIINKKGGGNIAYETSLREFENYFCPELIKEIYGCNINANINWSEADVPEIIAKHNHENSESQKRWVDLEEEDIKEKKRKIKNQLNEKHSKKLTIANIDKIGAKSEIEKWFNDIARLLSL
ncbi:MAG TPA: ATP-binding protein [Puia sp.]|nr:ATP-binding protein [Puia sp.]